MKLTVMKVVCLLVLISGIFILGLTFDLEQAQQVQNKALEFWPKQTDGSLNLRLPGIVCGVILVLLGAYGFFPRFVLGRKKTITFRGAHGDITLELKYVRKILLKVMRKMPEIYAINLQVKPDADKRRALICADVVLKNCASIGTRRCAKMVAHCLASTASDVLGLEDLSTIQLNIKGIHVNAAAVGKQMREQIAAAMSGEETGAYALAHPPVSSVTLDEDSTDNTPLSPSEPTDSTAAPAVCNEDSDPCDDAAATTVTSTEEAPEKAEEEQCDDTEQESAVETAEDEEALEGAEDSDSQTVEQAEQSDAQGEDTSDEVEEAMPAADHSEEETETPVLEPLVIDSVDSYSNEEVLTPSEEDAPLSPYASDLTEEEEAASEDPIADTPETEDDASSAPLEENPYALPPLASEPEAPEAEAVDEPDESAESDTNEQEHRWY